MLERKEHAENIVLEVKLKQLFEAFKLNFGHDYIQVSKNKKKEKWFWYESQDNNLYFQIKEKNK